MQMTGMRTYSATSVQESEPLTRRWNPRVAARKAIQSPADRSLARRIFCRCPVCSGYIVTLPNLRSRSRECLDCGYVDSAALSPSR